MGFPGTVSLNRWRNQPSLDSLDFPLCYVADHADMLLAGDEIDEALPEPVWRDNPSRMYPVNWQGFGERVHAAMQGVSFHRLMVNIEPTSTWLDFTRPLSYEDRLAVTETYGFLRKALGACRQASGLRSEHIALYGQLPIVPPPSADSTSLDRRIESLDHYQPLLLGLPSLIFRNVYLSATVDDRDRDERAGGLIERAVRLNHEPRVEAVIRPTRVGHLNRGPMHTPEEIRERVRFAADSGCSGAAFWCDGGLFRRPYADVEPLIDAFLDECEKAAQMKRAA